MQLNTAQPAPSKKISKLPKHHHASSLQQARQMINALDAKRSTINPASGRRIGRYTSAQRNSAFALLAITRSTIQTMERENPSLATAIHGDEELFFGVRFSSAQFASMAGFLNQDLLESANDADDYNNMLQTAQKTARERIPKVSEFGMMSSGQSAAAIQKRRKITAKALQNIKDGTPMNLILFYSVSKQGAKQATDKQGRKYLKTKNTYTCYINPQWLIFSSSDTSFLKKMASNQVLKTKKAKIIPLSSLRGIKGTDNIDKPLSGCGETSTEKLKSAKADVKRIKGNQEERKSSPNVQMPENHPKTPEKIEKSFKNSKRPYEAPANVDKSEAITDLGEGITEAMEVLYLKGNKKGTKSNENGKPLGKNARKRLKRKQEAEKQAYLSKLQGKEANVRKLPTQNQSPITTSNRVNIHNIHPLLREAARIFEHEVYGGRLPSAMALQLMNTLKEHTDYVQKLYPMQTTDQSAEMVLETMLLAAQQIQSGNFKPIAYFARHGRCYFSLDRYERDVMVTIRGKQKMMKKGDFIMQRGSFRYFLEEFAPKILNQRKFYTGDTTKLLQVGQFRHMLLLLGNEFMVAAQELNERDLEPQKFIIHLYTLQKQYFERIATAAERHGVTETNHHKAKRAFFVDGPNKLLQAILENDLKQRIDRVRDHLTHMKEQGWIQADMEKAITAEMGKYATMLGDISNRFPNLPTTIGECQPGERSLEHLLDGFKMRLNGFKRSQPKQEKI